MSSILMVDDKKSLREFLIIMLESDGHQVVTAGEGETAVKKIWEESFDLVINKAAELLNISFRSMRYRLQKHKIKWRFDLKD